MDMKWPQPNMDFYKKATDPFNEVEVQNSGVLEADFFKYANNFYEAAIVIVNKLIGSESKHTGIAELDLWYFALIYLYRQSLELLLKANIFKLVQGEQDRKDIIGEVRHDVGAAFDKILEVSGVDISNDDNAKWLQTFLHDISRIDRESDMFRYPFGSNLRVLFQDQTQISLPATYYNMSRAFHALEGFYQTQQFTKGDYPEYEPKLIVEGGEYYQSSVVGYKYHSRSFHPYYTSYEECAKYLTAYIKRTGKDHLFMPMCYLYRNTIELLLKSIIFEFSNQSWQGKCSIAYRYKHSICHLLKNVDTYAIQFYGIEDQNNYISNMVRYCKILHEFDADSSKFRYPIDKKCSPYIHVERHYNFVAIGDFLKALASAIDGVHSEIDYRKDVLDTLCAEYIKR